MGEAKRRMAEISRLKEEQKAWRASLSPAQREIATLAERIDERLVRGRTFVGGCYHLAFFMTYHLLQHGIKVQPVVGWVNDGLWDGMTSHAWIEFEGKKTDTSLTEVEHGVAVPTGALIIHDQIVRRGQAAYNYYPHGDEEVERALLRLREDPRYRTRIAAKEQEHAGMMAVAGDPAAIEHYLFKLAPLGVRHPDLAAIIG